MDSSWMFALFLNSSASSLSLKRSDSWRDSSSNISATFFLSANIPELMSSSSWSVCVSDEWKDLAAKTIRQGQLANEKTKLLSSCIPAARNC